MVGNGIVHGHAKSKEQEQQRQQKSRTTAVPPRRSTRTFSVPTHGTFNTLRIRTKKEGIHRILKYEVSAPVSTILTHSVDNNDIDDNDDEEKNNDENLRCRKGFNESLPVDSDPCSGSEALTHAWPEKNLVQSDPQPRHIEKPGDKPIISPTYSNDPYRSSLRNQNSSYPHGIVGVSASVKDITNSVVGS